MKFSPILPIIAEDKYVPLAEAQKAWKEYIDGEDERASRSEIGRSKTMGGEGGGNVEEASKLGLRTCHLHGGAEYGR